MKERSISNLSQRDLFWVLFVIAVITIIPFLGLYDFHTKGEPREAVVAYSMLEQGNWILPTNNGGEIPYKPPFFHWCIALCSLLNGGVVNEFTSRLPSAIALIAMVLALFNFYSKREGKEIGLLTAIVTMTAFEIHRAAPNCRVDMMLTALTVGALLCFYRYWEKGLKGVPLTAILLMSCATLTKGPVGVIIPCLCVGVFLLLRGVNFFKAFFLLAAWGILSLILPLCWYYFAWLQGGEEFLKLVMEENFGRMTGTMSYDVHINPWYYNLVTVITGYLPWTLLALFSLFSLKKFLNRYPLKIGKPRFKENNPVDLYSWVCVAVIFLFYCIPSGKRSVYLMPLYPFLSYELGRYILRLAEVKSRSVKVYGNLLAVIGLIVSITFLLIKYLTFEISDLVHGKSAVMIADTIKEIQAGGWWLTLIALIPLACSVLWFKKSCRKVNDESGKTVWLVCVLTFGLYLAVDGAIQPAVFETKSQRGEAEKIAKLVANEPGTIYEYIAAGEEAAGDPIHFFELNFYLGDLIRNFRRDTPVEGYLLILDTDADNRLTDFEAEGYHFTPIYETAHQTLFHRPARLYKFTKALSSPSN